MIDPLRRDGRPLVVGHKGAAALAPENTLRSLEAALELGVDALEVDVIALRDGTLVLAHSDLLEEVTHGTVRGRIGERGLEALRLVAPELPTLAEALAFVAERADGVTLQVDVKWPGYERPVAEAIRAAGLVERTLVSSVFAASLRELGAAEPGLRLALTYPFDRLGISGRRPLVPVTGAALLAVRATLARRIGAMLERAGATVATLHHRVVTRAAVERCHARGAAVWAWTVDDPRTAGRLAALGVDAIVTNDPRAIAAPLP